MMKDMNVQSRKLCIGKTNIVRKEKLSYLCADVTISNHRITLWFAVERSQEEYLCVGRLDAFVMALLPMAMRQRYDIICDEPISERLLYQLNNYLIPTLAGEESIYHQIQIKAPFTVKQYPCCGAVGTGFSGGVDSLYTIMRHNSESEYPLTHIAVFNRGTAIFNNRGDFWENCQKAQYFGTEQNLHFIYVDTNLHEVLTETFENVFSFRNLACALALQGLFKIYLLSSTAYFADYKLDMEQVGLFDLLTVNCASTETLSFYLSGAETRRRNKLEALTDWEPSWHWLHPCVMRTLNKKNCGYCIKCIRDQTILYALGRLERYESVFDVKDYYDHLPQRIGVVLANDEGKYYAEAQQLLRACNVPIPQAAYIYEKQFRRAIRNLKASENDIKKEIL